MVRFSVAFFVSYVIVRCYRKKLASLLMELSYAVVKQYNIVLKLKSSFISSTLSSENVLCGSDAFKAKNVANILLERTSNTGKHLTFTHIGNRQNSFRQRLPIFVHIGFHVAWHIIIFNE